MLVKCEDSGTDVVEEPVDALQQVLPRDRAAPDDAPVMGLDAVEVEDLKVSGVKIKWRLTEIISGRFRLSLPCDLFARDI
jgi:hypothetical protein